MTGPLPVLAVTAIVLLTVPGSVRTAGQEPAGGPRVAATASDPPVTIRVTAVVRDARGRPVLDLRPADFSLEDNGVPQTLSSVELRGAPGAGASAAPPAVTSADDEQRAARDPDTRLVALFLDEFNVTAGERSALVRDAALRFVATRLRPQDLLCVLKPLASVTTIRFTRDRDAAREVIAAFEGRKGDYAPRSDFEREFFGRTPAAVEGARAQIVATALRELTLRIGELQPNRSALVLVSEGLARTPGGEPRRLPGWQALARAASHFNLPIYALDPREPEPAAEVEGAAAGGADPPRRPDRGLTLAQLAAQTGGDAFAGAAGLTRGLERVSRDLDGYYVLTYSPSAPTDGRFHPLVVRTARKALQIQAPTGYWSPLSAEWRTWLNRPAYETAALPTRAIRRSRLIDTWYGFEPLPDGSLRLVFTWQPAGARAGGRAPRPSSVALTASTVDGTTLVEQQVAAAGGEVADRGSRAAFAVPPGRLQLDFTITAIDGTVLDTAAQDIDVPRVRGAEPLGLQPQLVRARTAREVEALAAEDAVTPSPARTFRRTERLLVRVPAISPDGAPVQVTASLVNTRGQKIRDLDALPVPRPGAAQFDLPLAFLAPGEYGLAIEVTGAHGTTRQLLRFQLTA